ncbi:MAG TPA: hypothetical protein EYQ50_26820 [Verrucomicrobiales bacterium]|nr:hypothetical protein [Verrucomicrobiales bacterium]HIL69530.1 hypothetical protein [Verrucomicrobiota bacterium]
MSELDNQLPPRERILGVFLREMKKAILQLRFSRKKVNFFLYQTPPFTGLPGDRLMPLLRFPLLYRLNYDKPYEMMPEVP